MSLTDFVDPSTSLELATQAVAAMATERVRTESFDFGLAARLLGFARDSELLHRVASADVVRQELSVAGHDDYEVELVVERGSVDLLFKDETG